MNDENFKVAIKIKEIIYFFEDILINYPRKEYNLKNNILNTSYNLLELTYYTNALEDNRDINQKRMLSYVAMLDFYLEISYKNKCINLKVLKKGTKYLTDVRKLIYGWMKVNGSKV